MCEPSVTPLRSFSKPPPDWQNIIEAVAERVAFGGPAIEFRLRAGEEGRRHYPFLYLDHKYAPYYHCKLKESRKKRSSTTTTLEASTRTETMTTGQTRLSNTVFFNESDDSNSNLHDDLRSLSALVREDCHAKSMTQTFANSSQLDAESDKAGNKIPTSQLNNHLLNSVSVQHSAASTSSPEGQEVLIPYALLQEVHLLDSSGNESSGLNTYVIVSNTDSDNDKTPMEYLFAQPAKKLEQEPVYRLRPDTSTVFRASHHRILPVGFPLAAEVSFKNDAEIGIVIRRTVQEGQRLYDVKNAHGAIHKEVAENSLELHNGGEFDFRFPHQI